MAKICIYHRQASRLNAWRHALSAQDFEVVLAAEASVASEAIDDCEMVAIEADESVIEWFTEVAKQHPKIACAVLSDDVYPTAILSAFSAGADGLVPTGMGAEEIASQFKRILARRNRLGPRKNVNPVRVRFKEREYPVITDRTQMLSILLTAFNEASEVEEKIRTEIAQRKEIETFLLESEARKRAIFEAALDCIIVVDEEGHIMEFNRAAEQKFMCTRGNAIGQDLVEKFVAPSGRGRYRDNLERYTTMGEAGSMVGKRVELQMVRTNGESFIAELAMQPFPMQGQSAFAVFLHDVTARHEAAEKSQQHAQELERSNRDLSDFAYAASHDLQQPLRTISSYCKLIEKRAVDSLDEECQEFLTSAIDSADRMQILLSDLLKYSRVSTKGKQFVQVDLNRVLEDALANLEISIEETNTTIAKESLPPVHGDPTQLMQLFQNLIGNAIKFCRDHPPKIEVGAERKGKKWSFYVRDNGIGIHPDQLENVFTIFRRLQGVEDIPGTGVGLAICNKIVERHEGRIWVESTLGEGATFFFTIGAKFTRGTNAP